MPSGAHYSTTWARLLTLVPAICRSWPGYGQDLQLQLHDALEASRSALFVPFLCHDASDILLRQAELNWWQYTLGGVKRGGSSAQSTIGHILGRDGLQTYSGVLVGLGIRTSCAARAYLDVQQITSGHQRSLQCNRPLAYCARPQGQLLRVPERLQLPPTQVSATQRGQA